MPICKHAVAIVFSGLAFNELFGLDLSSSVFLYTYTQNHYSFVCWSLPRFQIQSTYQVDSKKLSTKPTHPPKLCLAKSGNDAQDVLLILVLVVKPTKVQLLHVLVLSGCLQLNRQKLRVGSFTEEMLKWFNFNFRERTLRTRQRTGLCKPLMPDVVAPKAHLNNCSYVSSTDLSSEFSMVGGYTENLEKPQNCQNWVVDTCTGIGTCLGQYGSYIVFL